MLPTVTPPTAMPARSHALRGTRVAGLVQADHSQLPWATAAIPGTGSGRLEFAAPAGTYAPIPTWRTKRAWMAAARLHPFLEQACRQRSIDPRTLLRVLELLSSEADPATGRGIALAHAAVADQLGVCTRTVQRAERAAEDLGLLVMCLRGCDMSESQRWAVIDYFPRGAAAARWRRLPNYYAATMPRYLAGLVWPPTPPVDKRKARNPFHPANVHLPRRGSSVSSETRSSTGKELFTATCGPLPRSIRSPAQPKRTVAALPIAKNHLKKQIEPAREVEPDLWAYATALRSSLPGYRTLPIRRIARGVQAYFAAGISVPRLQDGLDAYLAEVHYTWRTHWHPHDQEDQIRYLIGMIKKARLAGYIKLPTPGPGSQAGRRSAP